MRTHIAQRWLLVIGLLVLVLAPALADATKKPINPQARTEIGLALALLRAKSRPNLSQIKSHLLKANSLQAGIPVVLYNLGVIAELEGDHGEALRYFNKVRSLAPRYAPAIAKLGVIKFKAGDNGAARRLFQQAVELDKFNPIAHNYLSLLSRRAGRHADAIRHARFALMGNRENIMAYNNMAATYFQMGSFELARLICESAIKLRKRSPATYNLLGLIYLKLDNVERAISEFRRALKYDPNFFEAHLNLAVTALNFSDFNTSLRHATLAVQRRPRSVASLIALAVAHRGLKQYDKAIAVNKRILGLDAKNTIVRYNLCILNHEYLQKYEAALGYCRKYLELTETSDPRRPEVEKRIKGLVQTIKILKSK